MPITGRLTTAGHITLATCPPHDIPENTTYEDVQGVVLEMDEANTRAACGRFLTQRVAIWAADELVPRAGSPAMEPTPENMQHLAMRLEAAEEHLAREVRSNEAAIRVRVDLEEMLKQMRARELDFHRVAHERDRLAAELAAALSEVNELRRAVDDMNGDYQDLADDAAKSLAEISEVLDD